MSEDATAHVIAHDRAGARCVVYESRAAWLHGRRRIITSTDIGAIAGVSKYGTALSVYAEKMLLPSAADDADDSTDEMLLGKIFQKDIARAYQILRMKRESVDYAIDHVGDHTLVFHATRERHGTSMDCWQWPVSDDDDVTPLEVKKVNSFPDDPLEEWLTQVQWQMYCTGTPAATIVALCGGIEIRWWDIPRDEELIGALRVMADEFWKNHVEHGLPPSSDGSFSSSAAMRKLYPVSSPGLEVTLEMTDLDTVVRIQEQAKEIDLLQKAKAANEDMLKAKMGTAEVAYLPNGGKITWKSFDKSGYAVKPMTVRPFRIIAEPPIKKGK